MPDQTKTAALLTAPTPLNRKFLALLWVLAVLALPVRSYFEHPAWDLAVYRTAAASLLEGHDPYSDAMAIQEKYHQQFGRYHGGTVPLSYVYSPITLPILRLVARLPLWVSGSAFWTLYLVGLLAQVWVGFWTCELKERRYFIYLTPAAIFFPGYLASDIVWSGNIAFIIYGAVLLSAVLGWKRGRWSLFYAAVLLASCAKPPLLTLLAIPVLSARRQWLPAGLCGLAGLGIFLTQPLFWPTLFKHFLQAVELQFSYNRDFGSSPAGLLGGVLFDRSIPYAPAIYWFYLLYTIPVAVTLAMLSRRFLRGVFPTTQWLPVLFVGVVLLNPRILEYDENFLAIPMALILWRFFSHLLPLRGALFSCLVFTAFVNCIAFQSWSVWKLTEAPLISFFFIAGSWTLFQKFPEHSGIDQAAVLDAGTYQPQSA